VAVILTADEALEKAAKLILAGNPVAVPTETVYGLAADATNGDAVARIYEVKGRPRFNPLIVHVGDMGMAERIGEFDPLSRRLAQKFWPGPLTLVLPLKEGTGIHQLVRAGLDTIALRMPAHRLARELLMAFGKPIVAPSANRSGHVSPTRAEHVLADLRGRIDLILDGGACAVGVESTIVSLAGAPTLLRPGGLPRDEIERVLGVALADAPKADKPSAPGMLASHYAPKATLRLNAERAQGGEALLAFGPINDPPPNMLNLSPRGDLIEAAANLFSHLRALDRDGAKVIAVMKVPREGLGEAINDRLRRAAAPRT
jgi:L-threonylcarbamoyladenylate synthase